MPRSLKNRVIVITGASSGIGAATAVACAQAGMHLVLAARREEKLRQLADRLNAAGARAVPVVCDVRRDADVHALIERTVDAFGRLDVMFANAGYGLFAKVIDTTDQQMRDIFETNFFGTVRCIQAAVPLIRRTSDQGHILICSSAASEISVPMYGFYAATKAAQDSIGGALRAELAGRQIAVSTIHPIGTHSEFFNVVEQESANAGHGLNTPTALMHSTDRVAKAVLRCLRRPRPEVWPSATIRLALAAATASPAFGAWLLRRMFARHKKTNAPPTDAQA